MQFGQYQYWDVEHEFSFKCYRTQAYYESAGAWRGTWTVDGGGAIMNQTIHSVDQMLWIMGEAEMVTARSGTFTHKIETEDTAVGLVTFKNGGLGVLIGTTTFRNDRPIGHMAPILGELRSTGRMAVSQ